MKRILLLLPVVLLSGCLKTRSDVKDTEQRQVIQQQVVSLQRTNADVSSRFGEYDEEIRALRGRVEDVENKLNVGKNEADSAKKSVTDQNADTNRKISLLQESLVKMQAQIEQLNADIAGMKAEVAAAQANSMVVKDQGHAKKNSYEAAEDYFNQKDWKKAILSYQKYRDENPKGKNLPRATLRIAYSFQELGMKEEAKTFYEEVLTKYPNSDEARKAKTQLKSRRK